MTDNESLRAPDDDTPPPPPPPVRLLIVGAGPVGLMLAVFLRRFDPTACRFHIDLIEKRRRYTRRTILLLNDDSLRALPRRVHRELFEADAAPGCFVLPPERDDRFRCYRRRPPPDVPSFGSIVTRRLEAALARHVRTLRGVRLHRPSLRQYQWRTVNMNRMGFVSIDDGRIRLPYDVLIGADGAASSVRTNVMGVRQHPCLTRASADDDTQSSSSQGAFVVAAFAKIPPERFGGVYDQPSDGHAHIVAEQTEQQDAMRLFRSTVGDVTILMGADAATHAQLLHEHDLNESTTSTLRALIVRLMRAHEIDAQPSDVFGTTSFRVRETAADCFANAIRGHPVFLVGDAAVSGSVNLGFVSAAAVAALLMDDRNATTWEIKMSAYNAFMRERERERREFLRANARRIERAKNVHTHPPDSTSSCRRRRRRARTTSPRTARNNHHHHHH